MNKQDFIELLHKKSLTQEELKNIENLILQFPYSPLLKLLYLFHISSEERVSKNNILSTLALQSPSSFWLKDKLDDVHFIHSDNPFERSETNEQIEIKPVEDTPSKEKSTSDLPTIENDSSINSKKITLKKELTLDGKMTLIAWLNSMKRSEISSAKEQKNEKKDEQISETLAEIYISQGHLNDAIAMYEKLALRFPKKNTYFADKIKNIKVKV